MNGMLLPLITSVNIFEFYLKEERSMRWTCGILTCLIIVYSGAVSANTVAIEKATSQFYKALNMMFIGNAQPMNDIWSHASDVTYMGPDGTFRTGWEKVEKEWIKQAKEKLGGEVHPTQVHTVIGKNLAVVFCIETGKNLVDGKTENVQIRASTIFRNEGGSWKVIGHQTDKLEYMSNR